MNILDYCQFCIDSYAPGPPGEGWYDIEDLRVGLIFKGGQLNIIPRGSANGKNWLRDFFVMPKRSFDGYLEHGGVVDAANLLIPLIEEKLKGCSVNIKKAVAGHSLGGGIARIISRYFGNIPAVTFGALCTDFRFGADPMNREYAVRDEEDPVWLVPHILYRQNTPPIIMLQRDDAAPVNAKHHFITHYYEKLQKYPNIDRIDI